MGQNHSAHIIDRDNHHMPQEISKWTLIDWERECAGGKDITGAYIYSIFAKLAEQAKENGLSWWIKEKLAAATLSEWRNKGIPARKENIMMMLSVLRRLSSQHRQPWFSDDRITKDIEKFLDSSACRNGRELSLETSEIEEIRQLVPLNPRIDSFFPLRRRLFPPPPDELYGRTNAIERVKQSIANNIVTVIAGLPGQGKTSLAWHMAVKLVLDGSYDDFDWTTHKYTYLDPQTGEKKDINTTSLHYNSSSSTLAFDDVLKSMSYRFHWTDTCALTPIERENKCAELLASRKYLIVLDNIETMRDTQAATEYFTRLKGDRRLPFNSRVLITSRQDVTGSNVELINLDGIDSNDVSSFFDSLARDNRKIQDPLQKLRLWEACHGNPLLMMIAFYRFTLGHKVESLVKMIKGINGGFETIFYNIFEDFMSELNLAHLLLAQAAAVTSERGHAITFDTLKLLWEKIYSDEASLKHSTKEATFNTALLELVKYRILTLQDVGEYAMHPLIKSYLAYTHANV